MIVSSFQDTGHGWIRENNLPIDLPYQAVWDVPGAAVQPTA